MAMASRSRYADVPGVDLLRSKDSRYEDVSGIDTSRSGNFSDESTYVKTPTFYTMQQGAGRREPPARDRYNDLSVLDNYLPSGNGFGIGDRNRLTAGGGAIPAPNGVAQQTWEKRQWITSPYRTLGQ
jgi:hypothetical protein